MYRTPVPPGEGWSLRESDLFPSSLSAVWERIDGEGVRIGMVCGAEHDNGNGAMHGGLVATLADIGLGRMVRHHRGTTNGADTVSATVSLDLSFTSAVLMGEFVESHGGVLHSTRSMTFAAGTLRVGERTVVSMQGVFKLVARRKSQSKDH